MSEDASNPARLYIVESWIARCHLNNLAVEVIPIASSTMFNVFIDGGAGQQMNEGAMMSAVSQQFRKVIAKHRTKAVHLTDVERTMLRGLIDEYIPGHATAKLKDKLS